MSAAPDAPNHTVLVIGPMDQVDANGTVIVPSRALALKKIVRSIFDSLPPKPPEEHVEYTVVSPEDLDRAVLTTGVFDLIERAELVVIDLTGNKPNVAYEVALVHALGLPHIFVTSGMALEFYFQPANVILSFDRVDSYQPGYRPHYMLARRIEHFVNDPSPGNTEIFIGNIVTQYYGLPVVDIAGPSGLAAGYYINNIWRVARRGGYLGTELTITWQQGDVPRTDKEFFIGHMFAVRPPGNLLKTADEDLAELDKELKRLKLRRQKISIPVREAHKAADMRAYGCDLLVNAETGEFLKPGVMIEIPTTLYALQYSPRVRRLDAQPRGAQVTSGRRTRLLQLMLDSFGRNLDYQIHVDPNAVVASRIHYVAVSSLQRELVRAETRLP